MPSPFTTDVFGPGNDVTDPWPASYHYHRSCRGRKHRVVANPVESIQSFLESVLSLGSLNEIGRHLWFAGAKHPATRLHLQIAMGRRIMVADRMDLHLLWDHDGKIFLKPMPRYLLDLSVWHTYLKCPSRCRCNNRNVSAGESDNVSQPPTDQRHHLGHQEQRSADQIHRCKDRPRQVALGFLYTYACLISSDVDFQIANGLRLLPRNTDGSLIEWAKWKKLAREILEMHDPDRIHTRFLRAELRLSRINTIRYLTRLPRFDRAACGWRDYGSLFRDNLNWMAIGTIFFVLVLTAMQVGLATARLKGNVNFQRASYGFTVFAILAPMGAFGLVILGALLNLAMDLPWLLQNNHLQLLGSWLAAQDDSMRASTVLEQTSEIDCDLARLV